MRSQKLYLREFIFGLNLFSVGYFHPDLDKPIIKRNHIIIYFISWIIMQISFTGGIFEARDFNDLIYTITCTINQLLSIVKYLTHSMNRSKVHNMIKVIEVDGIAYSRTTEFVKKSSNDAKMILLNYIIVAIAITLAYAVGASMQTNQPEEVRMWELAHIYIPYDFVINKRFGILRLTVVCLGACHAYCGIFLDIFSASLFTHIGGQFEAVGDMFSRINLDPTKRQPEDEDADEMLSKAIEYHKAVLKCAADLQSMFSVFFMAQIIASCLPLCFSMFLVARFDRTKVKKLSTYVKLATDIRRFRSIAHFTSLMTLTTAEGKLIDMMSNATFVVYLTYQLFLMTRCAHLCSERASQVADGVYLSNWYMASPGARRMLTWVIQRAQHPVPYMALSVFPVTSNTFIQILRSAYAAFTLMTKVN